MSEFAWKTDIQNDKKYKPLSSTTMRNLGIKKEDIKIVADLEELKEYPPNIIIATATKNLSFVQNYFKTQELKKRTNYVMGLGVFQQLHANPKFEVKYLKASPIKFKNLYKRYNGEDLSGKTLLVFRTGGIGDLLFIQPNLIFLKKKFPDCKIHFACGPQYQSMVETWNCIDKVLDLPFTLQSLKEADYHALFEGVIERCTLAQTNNAYNLFSRWLGLDLPNNLLVPHQKAKQERVDFCLEKLQNWNLKPKKFILTQLRASSPIRTPRPDFWARIINSLIKKGHNILITDNPRQADNVDNFIDHYIDNKEKVFNFCRESISLDYSIAVTSLASCVVATDSAMNHIASSLGVKSFGIYGPFPGSIRMKTYPNATWIDATRYCGPCFIHGQKPCPHNVGGYSPCYDDLINTEEKLQSVVKKITDLLDN